MTAAEPRGELAHEAPSSRAEHLRVRRPVRDPERPAARRAASMACADLPRRLRARPDVCERDAERRRLGDDAGR